MGKEIGEAEKTLDCDAGVILWREIKKSTCKSLKLQYCSDRIQQDEWGSLQTKTFHWKSPHSSGIGLP